MMESEKLSPSITGDERWKQAQPAANVSRRHSNAVGLKKPPQHDDNSQVPVFSVWSSLALKSPKNREGLSRWKELFKAPTFRCWGKLGNNSTQNAFTLFICQKCSQNSPFETNTRSTKPKNSLTLISRLCCALAVTCRDSGGFQNWIIWIAF